MASYTFPKSFIDDTKDFLEIDSTSLSKLDQLSRKESVVSPEILANFFEGLTELTYGSNWYVAYILSAIAYIENEATLSSEEEFAEILSKFFGDDTSDDNNLKCKILAKLLFSDKMFVASKLFQLSYDHRCSIEQSKIIVDARPIFTKNRDKIVTYALLSLMKLEYTENSKRKHLNVYMNKENIEALRDQCAAILDKIDKTSEELSASTRTSIYVPGLKARF